ncbi:MAG TPA: hypothetical protein VHO69_17200 [Phototrophicaceae bacterium]|nr:hypothetical protein [Phototrophicaceae bacterium]
MNTSTAIAIAARVAELTDLATRFQAQYGKLTRLTSTAPVEAHRLQKAIFGKQRAIAYLLDTAILLQPTPRWPWWKHQTTIDLTTVSDLAHEVNHLIACCAYFEVDTTSDLLPAIQSSQAAIAGMVHPEARAAAHRQHQQGYAVDNLLSWN